MKVQSKLFWLVISLFIAAQASAKDDPNVLAGTLSTKAEKSAPTQIMLGWKSYNSSGRFGSMNDDANAPSKGQVLNGKQEAFLGYRFLNGWGSFVQLTQYRLEYNNKELNKWSVSDPSLTLIHPDLYNDGTLKIRGQVRGYLPYTTRSKDQNIRQYAYYSTQTYELGKGRDLFNQFIPRWFAADRYNDGDTRFYIENRTVYTQKINSWSRWGIGNWFQMEQHAATETGYTSEVIPQLDILVTPTVFFGPRVSLPVFSQNSVYDGPKNATFEQARGELYFQATL